MSFPTRESDSQKQPSLSLLAILDTDLVAVGVSAVNWQAAIRAAGHLLVEQGAAEVCYVDAMLRVVEELGPYIVIAPGVALAHARPEDGVIRTAISVVCLREPVAFGHSKNDPVVLVLGLSATDHKSHIRVMSELAYFLDTPCAVQRLSEASTPQDVRDCIGRSLESVRQEDLHGHRRE